MVKIGYLQFEPVFGDISGNLLKISKMIRECDLDLIVLPELCTTGYSFLNRQEIERFSETKTGETVQFFLSLSKEVDIAIVFSIAECEEDDYFISSMLTKAGELVGMYRKRKLAANEMRFFTPGTEIPEIYQINGYNIGLMICIEFRYPDIFQELVDLGADIVCHSMNSSTPQSFAQMENYSKLWDVISVSANRIGIEDRGETKFNFIGHSQIVIPQGNEACIKVSSTGDADVRGYELD